MMAININYKQLNEAQREAVTLGDENAVVISVPGSGKSTCLVNRIAHLLDNDVSPDNLLAITFAKEAATNMIIKLRSILPELEQFQEDIVKRISINTFHAFTYRLLIANDPYWKINNKPSRDFEFKKLMVEICCKILKLESKDKDVDTPSLLHFITYQKNQSLSPDDKLEHISEMPYPPSVMKKIYFQWEKLKRSYKIVDFADMTWDGYKLIRDNDNIRHALQKKYQYIVADEQNDATQLQYDILRLIGLKAKSVVIFGDPLQEIYQFLGASNRHMKNFVKDFDNVKVINSNINYRSQSKIIDCYNKFIIPSPETKYKYYHPAKAHKGAGEEVVFNVFINGMEEAKWIGNKIKQIVEEEKRYKYSDILLLYRTNSQSRSFEEVFMKNEIPYHLSDGMSFYHRKEIKDIMSYLRLINNSSDNESWDRIANIPNRFFGSVLKEEVSTYAGKKNISFYDAMLSFPRRNEWRYQSHIDRFEYVINKCRVGLGRYKISTIIETLRKELDYDKYISKEYGETLDNNRIDNLNSFQTQAEDYKDLTQFIKNIDILTLGDDDKNSQQFKSKKDQVELKSCHSSKGLEAEVVFVVGFSEGLIPHHMNENIEAERLLGYVALSRAKEQMFVSSILNHNKKELEVSSFLYNCFDEAMIEAKIEECVEGNSLINL